MTSLFVDCVEISKNILTVATYVSMHWLLNSGSLLKDHLDTVLQAHSFEGHLSLKIIFLIDLVQILYLFSPFILLNFALLSGIRFHTIIHSTVSSILTRFHILQGQALTISSYKFSYFFFA